MKLLVKNQKDLVLPSQAHPNEDVGYDLSAKWGPIVRGQFIERADGVKLYKSIDYIEYGTGIFVASIAAKHIEIYPRSSISNKNLVLANSIGLIDTFIYRGELILRFKYIVQPEDLEIVPEDSFGKIYVRINEEKIYQTNDKIGQMVAKDTEQITFEVIDDLNQTKRGGGGFGSSGD